MCGIIGVASTGLLVENDKKFFRSALFADQLRGADSTGIFAVGKQTVPTVDIFKRAMPAADFLEMKRTDQLIGKLGTTRLMVGHNRAATKGAVDNENCHPFQFGHITMVHNGTLTNYHKLPNYTYAENDSKLLCRGIAELGLQEAINCIDGAWSLVWHDSTDNTLNFLRNSQRPMAIASNNKRKDLYFASELLMLDWCTARHNISVDEILNTQVNQHIKLSLDADAFDPVVTEVIKKTNFFVGNGGLTKKPENNSVDKPAVKQGDLNVKARDTLLASKLREIESEGTPVPRVGMKSKAYFYNITAYKGGGSTGVMLGTMCESPWLTVELHNQKVENFAEGYYEFTVCGRRIEGGITTGSLELLGHAPRIVGKAVDHPVSKDRTQELAHAAAKKTIAAVEKVKDTEVNVTVVKKPEHKSFEEKKVSAAVKLASPPATPTLLTPNSMNKVPLGLVSTKLTWRQQQKKLSAPKVIDADLGKELIEELTFRNRPRDADPKPSIDPDFPYVGYNSCWLSQDVYDQLTRHGCCQCSSNISDDDAPDLLWLDTTSPVCLSCQAEQEYGGSMDVDNMKKVIHDKDIKADGCPPLPEGHSLH